SSLLKSSSQAKTFHDYIRDWSLIALSLFLLFPAVTSSLPTVVSMFPSVFGCYPLLSEGSDCARNTDIICTKEILSKLRFSLLHWKYYA
ncbi:MAG: hypothetical protein WBE68_23480, partial [Candidatus Nitrosopolaris sp.]